MAFRYVGLTGEHITGTKITLFEHRNLKSHRKVRPFVYTAMVDGSAFPGYYESRHAALLAATLLTNSQVIHNLEVVYGIQYQNRPVTEAEVLDTVKHLAKRPNPR